MSNKLDRIDVKIFQKADVVASLFTKGDYATAQCELVVLLDSIVLYFSVFSEEQKIQFSYFIKQVTDAIERRDYYAVADFLKFELPYIINCNS